MSLTEKLFKVKERGSGFQRILRITSAGPWDSLGKLRVQP